MRFVLPLMTFALAGSGAVALARKPVVPEARALGAAKSCLSLQSIRESKVRSDKIIDFRTSGRTWYRNELPYACPSLAFEERFSYRTSHSQLCSTDVITVLRGPGISRGASCGLGKFQPVELAKK